MPESLAVHFADRPVGTLEHDRGRLALRYAADATSGVSRRLSVAGAPYGDEPCRVFVANLLPEGDWRGLLCRRLQLPTSDDFGLLAHLGHECAGAVSFSDVRLEQPARPSLWPEGGAAYTPLAETKLREWLREPLSRPTPEESPGLRRALAGAQDKLILHLADGEPYLCERGAPSTIILKPDIAGGFNGVQLTALNELFCMQLARAVGLRVPRSFWFAGAFAVERFDRVLSGSSLERVHQEDFAQLLGVPPSGKYEINWRACFRVVREHLGDVEQASRELFDRLLFNLLIGNADAHGKNFALLLPPSGAQLAPAYDLLCTQAYPALSDAFVMKVGPARRQSELTAQAWQQLAADSGLAVDWIKQRGAELCASVQLALKDLPTQITSENPGLAQDIYPLRRRDDFLRLLVDIMVGNCKRVARALLARA